MTPRAVPSAYRAAVEALAAGRPDEAEAMLAAASAASPGDPNLRYLLGNCALARGDDEAALSRYAQALDLAPDFPAALLNVGFIHRRHHRVEAARAVLGRCVALAPGEEAAWVNLTATFVNEGESVLGEEVARSALRHHAASPSIRWNLALLLLEQGKWAEGWSEFRHRFEAGVVRRPTYGPGPPPPRLEAFAELRPGQTVVCHGEQGIGDEILFSGMIGECAAEVAARGARLLLDPNPRLRSVIGRTHPMPLVDRGADGSPHGARVDWVLPVGDLGGFFRRADEAFPLRSGYVRLVEERVASIRRALRARSAGRPLVGLAWTGGSAYTHARSRHVPLAEWVPLLRQPASFVSLEYRDRSSEIANLESEYGLRVEQVSALASAMDYDDVLHLVAALDLVVTVPTSVLHAAGAVGTPCLVVMHARAAWRECSRDGRIPWYPRTHRRFVRPADAGSWRETIDAVAAEVGRSITG